MSVNRLGSRRLGVIYCVILASSCLAGRLAWGQQLAPLPPITAESNAATPGNTPQVFSGPDGQQETLDDAWFVAIHEDQRIQASRWNVSSAESSRAAAEAERLPALQLGANYYSLSDQPAFQANLGGSTFEMPFVDRNSTGFQAMVKQPIYTFGRISSGINAAQEAVNANQAECNKTRLDVKMNVADIYVQNLRSARMIEVTESRAKSLEAHNQDVARFFEKGLVSKNDLLAAQVALADARQQLLQAHNMQQIARAAYNRALGRELDTPVNVAELQSTELSGDPQELTQMAMRLRPEIVSLSAQARALREQSASLRARTAPQVGLEGGYLAQQNQYVDPNGVAVLLVGVEWTPVDSGRVSNQATALREKAESVIRTRKDAESMIALEVKQKWLDLQTARERLRVMRQATVQADENVRVARDRYQQQVGTNTEVLDAETLRVQTYINFYNSLYEVILAELRLHRAVGDL